MKRSQKMLMVSGWLCFFLAIFHIAISFSPSLCLYFGAPESIVGDSFRRILSCFAVAGVFTIFGLYAVSGAGYIRPLPLLKQVLVAISGVFILRGLKIVPELLVMTGALESDIPVAPRSIIFSAVSLGIGALFIFGVMRGRRTLL